MGWGYWILLWDEWGSGCVMINPRLHTEGEDIEGNPQNWWSCEEDTTDEDILAKHDIEGGQLYKVIR